MHRYISRRYRPGTLLTGLRVLPALLRSVVRCRRSGLLTQLARVMRSRERPLEGFDMCHRRQRVSNEPRTLGNDALDHELGLQPFSYFFFFLADFFLVALRAVVRLRTLRCPAVEIRPRFVAFFLAAIRAPRISRSHSHLITIDDCL